MATYYSTQYAAQAVGGITAFNSQFRSDPTLSHGRVRAKSASFITAAGLGAGTVFSIATMKSSDRILSCFFECGNIGASSATVDLGLYLVNSDGSLGTLVDVDAIKADLAVSSAVAWADVLAIGNRSQTIYEFAGASADTNLQYIIAGTTADAATDATGVINVLINYTSGD